jgi:hypothetical protein
MNFKNKELFTIYQYLKKELKTKEQVSIIVDNPDIKADAISLKSWVDVAQLFMAKLLVPQKKDDDSLILTFKKLNLKNSFHSQNIEQKEEKYGIKSQFFTLNKMQEASFLHYYLQALQAVKIETRKEILNLGVNKADEFELIKKILPEKIFNSIHFVGIDHSRSIIKYAQNRFKNYPNMHFFQADINKLDSLNLRKSDLIISIGTLQSPGINYKPFLMKLTQEYLSSNGAFILGFPNSRWIDGELIYGAKAPNYSYSELSLVCNDIIFAKKYLQQKKFRVTITGKEYLFITATKIGG